MTRCNECIYFAPLPNTPTVGRCQLTLPPFLRAESPFTTIEMGCDLGVTREDQ